MTENKAKIIRVLLGSPYIKVGVNTAGVLAEGILKSLSASQGNPFYCFDCGGACKDACLGFVECSLCHKTYLPTIDPKSGDRVLTLIGL